MHKPYLFLSLSLSLILFHIPRALAHAEPDSNTHMWQSGYQPHSTPHIGTFFLTHSLTDTKTDKLSQSDEQIHTFKHAFKATLLHTLTYTLSLSYTFVHSNSNTRSLSLSLFHTISSLTTKADLQTHKFKLAFKVSYLLFHTPSLSLIHIVHTTSNTHSLLHTYFLSLSLWRTPSHPCQHIWCTVLFQPFIECSKFTCFLKGA